MTVRVTGLARAAFVDSNGACRPRSRGQCADRSKAGASNARTKSATAKNAGAIDFELFARGKVNMLACGPAISAVDPVEGFISCTFERDATTISGGISWTSNRTQLKVLVIHRDGGRIHSRGRTRHDQIAADRDIASRLKRGNGRTAVVQRARISLIAANCLVATQGAIGTRACNGWNSCCRPA